jgi:transposase InsO family protein
MWRSLCCEQVNGILHTRFLSDRGTHFNNALINELCCQYQIKHHLTSSYWPQTNRMVEWFKRIIGESLAKLVMDNDDEKEWDDYVNAVLLAYRTHRCNDDKLASNQSAWLRNDRMPIGEYWTKCMIADFGQILAAIGIHSPPTGM